jgi:hypothetical protein
MKVLFISVDTSIPDRNLVELVANVGSKREPSIAVYLQGYHLALDFSLTVV